MIFKSYVTLVNLTKMIIKEIQTQKRIFIAAHLKQDKST
jgi:hypothetical protein